MFTQVYIPSQSISNQPIAEQFAGIDQITHTQTQTICG